MGSKKGRTPPSVNVPAMVSKKVTKQSTEIAEEAVVTVMEQRSCVHFDKCVNLDKLLEKIKSCRQIKCGECKEGVHVKRRSEGKSAKKAIWVCLECGHYVCGDVGLPTGAQSHVVRHIRLTRHRLVIQCENPRLRWCFPCQSLLPFEKEENGEKKDLLLDVVKSIKQLSSNTYSEDSCSGSGSISGKIKLEGYVSSGLEEARDGYAVRGLVNLGNTCFFNSVLQNLLSLDQLREHFLKEDLSCGGPLVSYLKKLFAETKSGLLKSVLNPRAFFSSLCSKAPQFRGYQQHDSHELLSCLLDGLSIEESSLRKKLGVCDSDDSCLHQKPTLIDSVFGGEISSIVSCLECGHSSKVYEPFLDLSLPVPSKKGNIPPKKVLKNGTKSKVSEIVSAMALDSKQVHENATNTDSFWLDIIGPETSHNETDLVLQGNVNETAPSTHAEGVDQTFVGSGTETLMHDNYGSAKPETVPYKEAMQSNKDTAASGISAEIDEAQVCGSSSANLWGDEELPLMVADSQVLYLPCKDDISYDDKTIAKGKGVASSSYVSGHHELTIDYVDFSGFFDDPSVSCNDKTIRECEGEASSSLVSGDHEQNVDYVDFSGFFDEPEICEGPFFGPPSKAEGEAFSSFMSGDHEQTIDYVDFSGFFDESEICEGPVFGPPSKGVSSNSDPEVLDDSDSPLSVDRCLAQFTKPEILSEDNGWHCENCSKNLKLQRLRENRKTKEGSGTGWVNENGASLASDEYRDNPLNQSCIDLENGNKTIPNTESPNCKDSEKVIVKRAATKRVLINKAPPVLTLHLKRFNQDARGRLSKLSGHVDFKEFIDLGQYMDSRSTEEDQPVYRLAGLVEHSGTMKGGHYVAYIRGGHKERRNSDIKEPNSSTWYRASDSYVRQVSFEEVLRSEAYILFYQRI